MDVLVSMGSVLSNGSPAQTIHGRLAHALRNTLGVLVAILKTSIHHVSVSDTAAGSHRRIERFQHIRSFPFASARGRCRSAFHPAHTMRGVRR